MNLIAFFARLFTGWMESSSGARSLIQRRISDVDHLRPQRWNWYTLVNPLDRAVEKQAQQPLTVAQLRGLRFFWLDGLFASISESFFLAFIPLFALAYGASNGQVGWISAVGNLAGAVALFPGAYLLERMGRRKPLILWSGGGIGRMMLLLLALTPLFGLPAAWAIGLIIGLNGVRAFMSNFGNPAWTALVADLVPDSMRGRYFGNRNMAMGAAALLVIPLAGWLIRAVNGWNDQPLLGYQLVFACAFGAGVLGTLSFSRIPEPPTTVAIKRQHQRGDLRNALANSPGFLGMVVSAFVFNLALQISGPFYNVYLVNELNASAAIVGMVSGASSLAALGGQLLFGRWLDRKGAMWVMLVSGFAVPFLPFMWILITAPWQAGIANLFGGFLWAGYNLANFTLLLALTPNEQRPRAVALYQTVVFTSAVIGPLIGGYLADRVGFAPIFAISGGGRFLAMLLFAWLAARPALRSGKGLPTHNPSAT